MNVARRGSDSNDLGSIFSTDSDVISEFCDKRHGLDDDSDPSRDSRSASTAANEDPLDALYKEQKTVRGARCIFLVILFLANAGALSWVIYWASMNGEQQEFGTEFEHYGNQIVQASNENIQRTFGAIETLSQTITAFVKEQSGNGYPSGFIKIPDSEFHFANVKDLANAYTVVYAPRVSREQYKLWNEFSIRNQDWIIDANIALDLIGRTQISDNDTLIYPSIHDVEFVGKDGKVVEADYDLATCTVIDDRENDQVTLSELKSQVIDYRRVPVAPSQNSTEFYLPSWQTSPPPTSMGIINSINYNLLFDPLFAESYEAIQESRVTTFFHVCEGLLWFNESSVSGEPNVLITTPVFDHFGKNSIIVGIVAAVIPWQTFFDGVLMIGAQPVNVMVENECGSKSIAFRLQGNGTKFLAEGYDQTESNVLADFEKTAVLAPNSSELQGYHKEQGCKYIISIFPTEQFAAAYDTQDPIMYAVVIFGFFFITSVAFFVFDWLIERRQRELATKAAKTNAIVSNLFPESIQKRIMEEASQGNGLHQKFGVGKAGLKKYLTDSPVGQDDIAEMSKSKPIADLFPETTVMFADIAGFTAWSSARQPSHVFTLLETIYQRFDVIAKKRQVFKVEVVGDCYVAVCGLPDPRDDHFVVMARFANECLKTFHELTNQLERTLGPDTADLGLRVGLHSGPVVAGVLRGEKTRFQLFGDTMNTASRMESTCHANHIQISQETANLLESAGKHHWFKERDDKVEAKGKGVLTTYFLTMDHFSNAYPAKNTKKTGSIDWIVEVMSSLLTEIAKVRKIGKVVPDAPSSIDLLEKDFQSKRGEDGKDVLDEVAEFIILPDCYLSTEGDECNVALDGQVLNELHDYVQTISQMYKENPFHNFDHASHVVMSVNKLLCRIVAPDIENANNKNLHDHTYGITCDPLTWFAVIFAALIHDVDHTGVSNAQLVKEGANIAALYQNKSVAEQNSFDLAWDLLMEPVYKNLRKSIYVTSGEFKRFRQLVVNSVMATDIVDGDLKKLRNDRWNAAFDDSKGGDLVSSGYNRSRALKATIVIEHLIQASDVSHTMQHWHIYRKWNECFFQECYEAYKDGRAESDPSKTWYEGELGFFDFYIIPLAKKLKECGVFGVSSDEYLSYAVQNRAEWEERGKSIVAEMISKFQRKDAVLDIPDQQPAAMNGYALSM